MEKQLTLFEMEKKDDHTLWLNLPEQNQQKIETLFVQILIKFLNCSLEAVKEYEK